MTALNDLLPAVGSLDDFARPRIDRADEADRENASRFSIRAPNKEQSLRMLKVRNKYRALVRELFEELDGSRERVVAVKRLEESFLYAMEGILRRPPRAPVMPPAPLPAPPPPATTPTTGSPFNG